MDPRPIDSPIHFSADRPIKGASEDLLNRAGFASRMSKAIRSWNGKESLVIGICGRWGAGKTSVKNLIKEALDATHEDSSPKLVEFVPWQVSGEEKITAAFFDELGSAIGEGDKTEATRKLLKLLKVYQARFKVGTYVLNSFPVEGVRKLVGILVGLAGLTLLHTMAINLTVAAVFLAIGALLWVVKSLDWLIGQAIAYLELKVSNDSRSLQEIKRELSQKLLELKQPIVMIIDDIDRLIDQEIALLFRLIKSNADFPNVIYVLLFDRIYVEDALNCLLPSRSGGRGQYGRGGEYLKKIVQVVFDLPESDRSEIQQILLANLKQLIEENNASQRFETERWAIMRSGIDPFFETVRDVNRFLSSLSFTMGAFKGRERFEVNPIDLIGLEVIRVFEPTVYERLKSMKETLVKTSKRLFQSEEKDDAKKEVEELVSHASSPFQQAIKILIRGMFPYTEEIFGGYSRGSFEEWFKNGRVCSERIFDRYFELEVSPDSVSYSDIASLIQLSSQSDELLERLLQAWEDAKLETILYALNIHKDEIAVDDFATVSHAFSALIERLPRFKGGMLDMDPAMTCSIVLFYILKKVTTETERASLLGTTIKESPAAYLPSYMVYLISRLREEGWGDVGPIFQNEESLEKLHSSLGALLDSLGQKDAIPAAKCGVLLNQWKTWGTKEKLDEWITRTVSNGTSLIALLKGFLGSLSSTGTNKMGWRVDVEGLEQFVQLDLLDEKVSNLRTKGSLASLEQLVLDAYEMSRARQKKGLKTDMFTTDGYIWSDITEVA